MVAASTVPTSDLRLLPSLESCLPTLLTAEGQLQQAVAHLMLTESQLSQYQLDHHAVLKQMEQLVRTYGPQVQ